MCIIQHIVCGSAPINYAVWQQITDIQHHGLFPPSCDSTSYHINNNDIITYGGADYNSNTDE